ncbi:MAG: hypothetical protein KBS40_04680 [Bacteroidales bacterium]|nr:hypothetical protein [Bacteroidales bacterium]
MKKGIIIFMMGMFTLHLGAQTYNGGTWYSAFDASEHSASTSNVSGVKLSSIKVFSPTLGRVYLDTYMTVSGELSHTKPEGYTIKVGNVEISTSDDQAKGAVSGSWGKERYTYIQNCTNMGFPQNASSSVDVKYVYKAYNAWRDVYVKNVRIPLAQHILLADGTYGTTAYTEPFDFGSVAWGATAATVDEVALRSFLTNGNITISSSDAQIFRINSADNTSSVTYNVGANACASTNGAAGQACADGVLGDINLYGFKIYFCPQEAKEYNGTITITDGTNTATVAVKGTGLKHDQTITFAPETPIYDTATIALATASSNLKPSYTFSPEGVVSFNGEKMVIATLSAPAQVTITASQDGNDYYNAATLVEQTITIYPSKTFGEDSAFVCPNDSVEYDGKYYQVGVYENVLLSVKNQYGSDSLVTFVVKELPTYLFEEYKTMWVGKDSTWRGKDLSGYAIGEYILYDSLQTVAGCDSVYQLMLTVNALPTVYGKDSAFVCPNDSVEYHGIHYKVGEYEVTLTNWLGGDSIVTFTVKALPTYLFEEYKTMWVGKDSTWRGKDLSGYAIGEYILYDSLQTVAGCDSVYQLKLTVTKVEQTITFELPTDTIKVEEILELSAEATSGLTVTYSFSADSLIDFGENVLVALLPGELIITATQGGDDTYAAAEPVSRTLTIVTGTLTDVREIPNAQPKAVKLMYKGQLFILRDNQYYNVQGSRVR